MLFHCKAVLAFGRGVLTGFCEIEFVLRAQTRFHAFPMSVGNKNQRSTIHSNRVANVLTKREIAHTKKYLASYGVRSRRISYYITLAFGYAHIATPRSDAWRGGLHNYALYQISTRKSYALALRRLVNHCLSAGSRSTSKTKTTLP
jgi:hypothetical protein